MKALLLVLLVTRLAVFEAASQGVTILQGESVLVSFTSLDFLSSNTNLTSVVEGRLFGLPGVLPSGCSVNVEYFADASGLGSPFFAQSFTNQAVGVYFDAIGMPASSAAWDDLDGSVRVTTLAGHAFLNYVAFTVNRPGETYFKIQPVPEPGTAAMLAGATVAFGVTMRSRRRRTAESIASVR